MRALDGVSGAADVAAEGLVGPHGLVNEEAGAGVGVIAAGGELLEDDAALFLELVGVEEGVADHVDDEVGGDVEVRPGDLAPVGGDLPGGGGVHEAADAVNGLTDHAGSGPRGGALEAEMLYEVEGACLRVRLVAGAAADEEAEGDGVGVGHGAGDDAEAVGEG